MNRQISKTLLVVAAFCGWAGAAAAYPSLDARQQSRPLPSATTLVDTEATLPPFAFMQFCMAYRSQCEDAPPARSFTLDARSWDDLQRINREVNDAIAPDAAKGSSDWSLETRFGNCNDYAVQKRDALIKLGYPMAALSLAVVRTAFGEGHLVLTARTDRGDFVLDNRRPTILGWNRTGYAWVKRQSVDNPQYWVAVSASASRAAQSVARAQPAAPAASGPPASSAPAPDLLPIVQLGRAWEAAPFGAAEQALEARINHVAAGRTLAMLALDDLGGWPLPQPIA